MLTLQELNTGGEGNVFGNSFSLWSLVNAALAVIPSQGDLLTSADSLLSQCENKFQLLFPTPECLNHSQSVLAIATVETQTSATIYPNLCLPLSHRPCHLGRNLSPYLPCVNKMPSPRALGVQSLEGLEARRFGDRFALSPFLSLFFAFSSPVSQRPCNFFPVTCTWFWKLLCFEHALGRTCFSPQASNIYQSVSTKLMECSTRRILITFVHIIAIETVL